MAEGLNSFLIATAISLGLVLLGTAIFYEILGHVWLFLPRLKNRPRVQIILTITASFVAHTAVVWLFGISYYLLASRTDFGDLHGESGHQLLDYIYFSGVTYSSLGFGDVYPTGGLRLLSAVEAILGLIMVGWTVAFTYVVTNKFLMHKRKRHGIDVKEL